MQTLNRAHMPRKRVSLELCSTLCYVSTRFAITDTHAEIERTEREQRKLFFVALE